MAVVFCMARWVAFVFLFFVLDFMLKWQVGLANGLNIPKMNPQKWHVRSASGLNIPQSMQMA